jgi:diguanylate cyclase (GGDEF)-like protein
VFPETAPEVQVNRPDGSSFEATIHFSPARFDGEDCTQLMIQRKDEAAELASELERLRSTDPVTRMANRKAFMEAVEAWVASDSQDAAAAVFYIEPDGFTAMQEDMDDSALEAYLCGFADVIRYSLEDRDLPARIGDGGFAVLARRPAASEMEALADTILQNCRGHVFEMEDRSISSTCSIGACQINRLMKEPRSILAHAKQVQSKASSAGDCYEFFRPQLTAVESPEGETEWVERIRRALGNNDFYVVQQPIVDLDGEGGKLMENIAYMRGEEGDFAFSRFREAAEHNDLGESIDREVIPNLLQNLVESNEPQILNLSENSIMDYGFQEWFVAQIRGAPVEGNRIIVQVATGAAHDNLRPVQALMQSLAPLGCRLSLCDFRGDPKARQLLEHLDASHVKLHHSLIVDLASDSSKSETIKKIVSAAREHGADVIAENVADTTGLAVLWQCGVKLIAGAFLEESSQVVAS